MPNPTIIPKKSVQSGAIPPTLALGEIAINHADRRLYSRNPATGEIYRLAGAGEAPDRVFVFDSAGDTTYLGYLLYTDVPVTGSIYDATAWEISRTQFSADGNSSSEASATGSWNSRTTLQFS